MEYVKIFSGQSDKVEEEINKWLAALRGSINRVLQSSTAVSISSIERIHITIFYTK